MLTSTLSHEVQVDEGIRAAFVRLSRTYQATASQEAAFRHLCNRVELAEAAGGAAGLVLAGDSGTGKSSTLARWREWGGRTYPSRPIYLVETQGEATPKSIAASILQAAGDPFAWRGSGNAMLARVERLVEEKRPLAIALDEFQHLFELNTLSQVKKATKFVKNLFNTLPVPIVLVGLPNVITFIRGSAELERRFSSVIQLHRCNFGSVPDLKDFRRVLRSVEEALPLEPGLSLVEDSMMTRFMLASDGAVGSVVELARGACVAARGRGATVICANDFSASLKSMSVGRDGVYDAFALPESEVKTLVAQRLASAKRVQDRSGSRAAGKAP